MKKLTKDEIRDQLNYILLKRNLIDKEIDFDTNTFVDVMLIIFQATRVLEHRFYEKQRKRPAKDLRNIYTLVEKYLQHEKRRLLELRKGIDYLQEELDNE